MPELSSVTVPAIKSFEHEGRSYQAGDPVSVPPVVALALSRKGYVSLEPNPTYQTREVTADEPAPRRRGRPRKSEYQRRDMQAET